jgi:membrane protein required for colicin V production
LDTFSFFDLIFAVAIVASAISGYAKGFVYQLTGLAGIIAGTYCSYKLSTVLTQWLTTQWWTEHFKTDPDVVKIVLFVVFAIVIYFLAFRLARLLDRLVKMAMLGWLNRLFGLLFGILKIVVIFCVLAYAVHSLNFTGLKSIDNDLGKSKIYPVLVSTVEALFPYICTDTGKDRGKKFDFSRSAGDNLSGDIRVHYFFFRFNEKVALLYPGMMFLCTVFRRKEGV